MADGFRELVSLGPFFGQISTLSQYYVPKNYATIASFMETRNTFGQLKSPPGRLLAFTAPFTINGMAKHYVVNGNPYLLVTVNNNGNQSIYYSQNSGNPPVVLSAQIVLPGGWVNGKAYFNQYSSYTFLSNGKNQPIKIDQNLLITPVGISGPTTWTASSLSLSGAGFLIGTYTYLFTWQTATQESTPLPASQYQSITTTTSSGNQVLISNIPQPSVSSGATNINIYRIGGVLGDAYRLVASIAVGVSTYTDNISDQTLSTSIILFQNTIYGGGTSSNQDPPLNFLRLVTFENALWGWGPQSDSTKISPSGWMYRSNTDQPEGWNVNNAIPCDPNDGDPVQRAIGFGTFLIVWKYACFGIIQGSNMQDYQWSRIEESGCIAPDSCAITPDGALFLSSDGLRNWNGLGGSQIYSAKVNDTIQAYSIADRQLAQGWYSKDLFSYFLSFPTLSITYQFNFLTRQIITLPFASDFGITADKFGDSHQLLATTGQNSLTIDAWFFNTAGDSHSFPLLNYITDRILIDPEIVFSGDHAIVYFVKGSGDFSITVTWDGSSQRTETENFYTSLSRDVTGAQVNYIRWNPKKPGFWRGSDVQIQIQGLTNSPPVQILGFKIYGGVEGDLGQ